MDAEEERVGNGNGAAAAAVQGGNAWDFEEGESIAIAPVFFVCACGVRSADAKTSTSHVIR